MCTLYKLQYMVFYRVQTTVHDVLLCTNNSTEYMMFYSVHKTVPT